MTLASSFIRRYTVFTLFFLFLMATSKNPSKKWITLLIIILLLGALVTVILAKRSGMGEFWEGENEASEQPPASPSVPAPSTIPPVTVPDTTTTPTSQKSVYKDGTYSAVGNYVSPGGAETVGVSLSLKNDVVTSVTIQVQARNSTSKNWQKFFADGVSAAVVGMKIDAVRVDTVSGSSLTPVGFMDALAKIKVQAKA